ncbi:hypothetical protein FALBO_16736 [Fusarium albosuccineum]|uniref:Uncharacterized protein n=1 Tax=Fusarium albosuccineum TaxID=1237068 RepID=A0A8H4KGX2_9HYPO|nr:hypothetical protein FALBO_16736 [Fusarium albosuccineum]
MSLDDSLKTSRSLNPPETNELDWVIDPDIAGPGVILSFVLMAALSLVVLAVPYCHTYSRKLNDRRASDHRSLEQLGATLLDLIAIQTTSLGLSSIYTWASLSVLSRSLIRLLVSTASTSVVILMVATRDTSPRKYPIAAITALESLGISVRNAMSNESVSAELQWLQRGNVLPPDGVDRMTDSKPLVESWGLGSDILTILLVVLFVFYSLTGVETKITRASKIACVAHGVIRLFCNLFVISTNYKPYLPSNVSAWTFGQVISLTMSTAPLLVYLFGNHVPATQATWSHVSNTSHAPPLMSFFPWRFWPAQDDAVPPGYRRISWKCSCGHKLAANFSNAYPDALHALEDKLHRLGNSDTADASPQVPQIPSSKSRDVDQAAFSTSTESSGQPSQSLNRNFNDKNLVSARQQATSSQSPRVAGMPKFFELCVTVGQDSVNLKEISISAVTTDRQLFDKIWDSYHEIKTSSFAATVRGWFFKPSDVFFVHFGVMKRHQVGIYGKPMEIPPPDEVDNGRYHYYECPMQPLPPMPDHIFLHYLQEAKRSTARQDNPEAHAEDVFLSRLPKKLGSSIFRSGTGAASGVSYGWGVQIIENPSAWAKSMVGIVSALICIVTFAITWACVNFDKAIGMGQLVTGVLAIVNGAIYFALQDYNGPLSRRD